nr:hypothetical protein [uncultured Campylobacter sp.]
MQNNVGDIDFLYGLCFNYGFIIKVANNTVIITSKDVRDDNMRTSNAVKMRIC